MQRRREQNDDRFEEWLGWVEVTELLLGRRELGRRAFGRRNGKRRYHEFSFLNVEIQLIRDPDLTIFRTGIEMGEVSIGKIT